MEKPGIQMGINMPSQTPASIESLPLCDQQSIHRMLDGLSERTKTYDWYGFASIGLSSLTKLLVEWGYFQKNDRGYLITPAGRSKLQELTALFGEPTPPIPEQLDSSGK